MNRYMAMNLEGRASNSLIEFSIPSSTYENGETNNNGSHKSFSGINFQNVGAKSLGLFPSDEPENNCTSNRSHNIFSQNFQHDAIAANRSNSLGGFSTGGDIQNERIVTPDFSIFASSSAGSIDLEPLPIGVHQNPQYQAALQSMLKESVHFLFGNENDESNNKHQESSSSGTKKRKRSSDCQYDSDHSNDSERFRSYQAEQWDQRLEDLLEFRRIHGHCSVPYDYPPNPSLARWVKRQRYQYKLFKEGLNSAMTERRMESLLAVGFVWDTYTAAWERRISELRDYKAANGNCNVPATYRANKKLAAWVKCQRRQYKLYQEGKQNTLSEERIDALNSMGFLWEMRSYRQH